MALALAKRRASIGVKVDFVVFRQRGLPTLPEKQEIDLSRWEHRFA
jgi:hypothetical protein